MSILKKDYGKMLTLELFPHCNLKCSFCFESNLNKRSKFYEKNETFFKYNKNMFLNNFLDKWNNELKEKIGSVDLLSLWGGELYFDNNKEYNNLLLEIINQINPTKRINITTNLTNINPTLYNLLYKEHNWETELKVSFDLVGRFPNKKIEEKVIDNIENIIKAPNLLKKEEKTKCIIQTILLEKVLKGECDWTNFERLYNNEFIDVFFQIETRKYKKEILDIFNQKILKIFFKYPKCLNITNLLNSKEEDNGIDNIFCFCSRKDTYFLSYMKDFNIIENSCIGNKCDKEIVKEKYNCKECKFKNRCNDMCASAVIANGLINNPCYKKNIFENLYRIDNENDTI